MSGQAILSDEDLLLLRHGNAADRATLAGHAAKDGQVAAKLAEWDRQDAALRTLYAPVAEEPVPPRLIAALRPPQPANRTAAWQFAAAAVVLLGLGFAGGWGMARLQAPQGQTLAMAALGSYATYAVEVAHPVEVPASDEAHLVKWLSKRLGQPIRVPDLARDGFRLIGGRLVPGQASPAGLLMYEDAMGRRLTIYVTRAEGAETDLAFAEAPGAQAFWWVDRGLGCALVGDLPRDTLRRLALQAYHDLTEV
ncbi:anti-sigma factor family protein [Fuscibacter oryzae]|uniref:Anti-sigma factor n=1 Tax=Fuscibacter oryzae TaxID=2803939 RepID=A0A8J7MUT5_9RHOB|nr:anti-sigma factor [Fuscibacter oryzae]MBL4928853.1 anti-sigma factor [Fuscibacter oryzae]